MDQRMEHGEQSMKRAGAALELTKKLIAIESTDPGAYEGEIGRFLTEYLSQIEGASVETEEVLFGRFNVKAELGKNLELPALVLICHMDTVVAGDGWTMEPFQAVERDGRIYGRGACDMKAGLACALSAFCLGAELWREGKQPSRRLVFIGTVDEEDEMRGAEAVVNSGWVKKEDWVLDTEPTSGQIQAAHKGRTWFELTVHGCTAHASTPWKGADAIAGMAEVIRKLRLAVSKLPAHEELGNSTVTFGQIEGGYRPYVVPDVCRVWIDMRLVPPTDTRAAERLVQEAAETAEKAVSGIRVSWKITGDRPYVEAHKNSGLLAALKKAVNTACGQEAETGPFPGYTDTAVIAGKLKSADCMSYGPGGLEQAHKPDEFVEVEQVLRCEAVLRQLIFEIFR